MLSFFLNTSRAFNTLCNYRIPAFTSPRLYRFYFSLYRYFNLVAGITRAFGLMSHDLIRNAWRDVPVRIRRGIVQIHVKPHFASLFALRQRSPPRASYPYIFTFVFPLAMRGRNPRSPLAAMPLKAFLVRKARRDVPVRTRRGIAQIHLKRNLHRCSRGRQRSPPQQSSVGLSYVFEAPTT